MIKEISYLAIEAKEVRTLKEVMACDILPVAIFCNIDLRVMMMMVLTEKMIIISMMSFNLEALLVAIFQDCSRSFYFSEVDY